MRTMRISWRTLAVGAAVALVAMVAGAAVRGATDQPPAPAAQPGHAPGGSGTRSDATDGADAEGTDPTGRTGEVGGGGGFARDEAGAVAAAMTYATAGQTWLYLSDEQIAEQAGAVMLPESRDRLVGELVDQVHLLRDELERASGMVWFVMAPLATRVDAYSPGRAVVRVWVVRVLSADGVAVPQSGWETLRFDLAWHGGDWRIADTDETDGPTPQPEAGAQPWSARYLDRQLEGFTRVGAAP